jgi:hypothetical protein
MPEPQHYLTTAGMFSALFGFVFSVTVIGVIVFDLLCFTKGIPTLSMALLTWGRQYPVIAWAIGLFMGVVLGIIAGHLWFPNE